MNRFDFTPNRRSTVGFDRQRKLEAVESGKKDDNDQPKAA